MKIYFRVLLRITWSSLLLGDVTHNECILRSAFLVITNHVGQCPAQHPHQNRVRKFRAVGLIRIPAVGEYIAVSLKAIFLAVQGQTAPDLFRNGMKQRQQIMPINTLAAVSFPRVLEAFVSRLDGLLIKDVGFTSGSLVLVRNRNKAL